MPMPLDKPTARMLAREVEARIETGLLASRAERHRLTSPRWPEWSPDLFTIWLGTPKTAGTTLGDILNRKFESVAFNAMARSEETDSALGIQRLATVSDLWIEVPEPERRSYKFTGGHLPYPVFTVFGQPCSLFTFLRDPVEHAISFYYFLVEVGLIGAGEATGTGRVTLERAIDEG